MSLSVFLFSNFQNPIYSFDCLIVLLSSKTQMNISIQWYDTNGSKKKRFLFMGIYSQEQCDKNPKLKTISTTRCVVFNATQPTWNRVEKNMFFPMGNKLTLEYRIHKDSGKVKENLMKGIYKKRIP
jgi:hypothetical protein